MAFQLRLNRLNDYQIKSRLQELGFRSKRGEVLQHRTVSRMLSNESYVGVDYYGRFRWRKVEGNKKREVTARPEEEWVRIEGFTPPIISRDVFDRAQDIKCEPSTRVISERKEYIMTGFSRCLTCASAVVGACMSRRYRYYRCRATTAQPATCSERYIPADGYDGEAWTVFSEAIREPEAVVAEFWRHLNVDTADEEAKVRREVEELRRKQASMLELRRKDTEGPVDDDIFLAQLAPVKALYDEKQWELALLEEQEAAPGRRVPGHGEAASSSHVSASVGRKAGYILTLRASGPCSTALRTVKVDGDPRRRVRITVMVLDPRIYYHWTNIGITTCT